MAARLLRDLFSRIDRQAWLRFFGALGGLTIAFAAALYSTIFRDLGNVLATAILASLALILAGVVGITTVPYLAKRVASRRLRERVQYDFTGEGAAYLVLLLVIVVAALNTGNNMLYIIVAAMLAAILISGIASAGMLRALELELILPEHVFAGRDVSGRIKLQNVRWWAPAFSLSVGPIKTQRRRTHGWQRGVWGFPPGRPPEQQWARVRDWLWQKLPQQIALPQILNTTVYFPFIERRSSGSAEVALNFPRRGKYQQERLGVATRFPFSFVTKTRPVGLAREILVYPPVEQTEDFFRVLPMITGEFEVFVRGRGNNLYLIREHQPEDSARHVDWKATAKTGALKMREFTREDERKVRVVFDNAAPGAVSATAYEKAIALAASLAWHFARSETQLSLRAPNYSGADVYGFLSDLATLEPTIGESVLSKLPLTDDYNVIITAQPHGSIPTSLWACSYLLFMQEI